MQLYQPYEQKIRKLAAIKAKILKYKYLILAGFLLIVACISTLLCLKGTIRKDIRLKEEYTYGDTIECRAKAFLSNVTVEYYLDGERVEKPKYPGEYEARAVAKGAFGGQKKGKLHTFTIQPKKVTASIASSITYGEMPEITTKDMVFGDTLQIDSAYVRFDNILGAKPQMTIGQKAVKACTAFGNDVTFCYEFDSKLFTKTDVILNKRPITISTESVKKQYDGTETVCENYTLTSGSLAYEDTLQTSDFIRLAGAGEVLNTATFNIYNKSGLNVTQLYAITYNFGTLNVLPKPFYVSTPDASKVYDGTPLPRPTYQTEGLLGGHTFEVAHSLLEVEPGIYENLLVYNIKDGSGEVVTEHYARTEAWGEAIIYGGRLVVSVRDQQVYDGMAVTYFQPTIVQGALSLEDTFIINSVQTYDANNQISEVRNAGKYSVEILSYEVFGPDVSRASYLIELQPGTFTVTKRPITVGLVDKEKYYDRTSLSSTDTVTDNLAFGHSVTATSSGSITQPGSTANVLQTVVVKDRYGVPVTDNYQITKQNGTLTVLKRQVTIAPLPIQKTYDGKAVAFPPELALQSRAYVEWTNPSDPLIDGKALLPGDYLRIDSVAISEAIVNVGQTTLSVKNGRIILQNGTADANRYYDVTMAEAIGEIVPMQLTIASLSHTKKADGTPLVGKASDCYIAFGALQNGESISYTVQGSQGEVGQSKNAIVEVVIKKGANIVGYAKFDVDGSVLDGNYYGYYNYLIAIECGWLTITPDTGNKS